MQKRRRLRKTWSKYSVRDTSNASVPQKGLTFKHCF